MNKKLIDLAFNVSPQQEPTTLQDGDILTRTQLRPGSIRKVRDRTFGYSHRYRGTWYRPEYDVDEIQIAQDTDSFIFRSVKKKVDRVFLSGHSFVSKNTDALDYINSRIQAMSMATQKPWEVLLKQTFGDLFPKGNCVWVKKRDSKLSLGNKRKDIRGVTVDPVAGYFIAPFERLLFKSTMNGEIKKVMIEMPDGVTKEYFPQDIIHFYDNRKPGFTMGTPELYPALDDIALLRRIEENVEELIETNLFPVFHYKVGNDQFPERYAPDGLKETDIVKETVEYMPSGGVYISDHRHEIKAIGSESKALRIDFYLTYFKKRAMAALGTSSIDLGEGDTANRSTASTLTQATTMDVEAMAKLVKTFIDFYVINELLLEGGYNPLDPNEKVEIQFGIINRQERIAVENSVIQKLTNKVITLTEARQELGYTPMLEADFDDTYYKRFEEPLALLRNLGPGSAAGDILSGLATSNVTKEAVAAENKRSEEQNASMKNGVRGRRPNAMSEGNRRAVAAKARPSNQHGTMSGPKLNGDRSLTDTLEGTNISDDVYQDWWADVVKRHQSLIEYYDISIETVAENMRPQLIAMNRKDHD